MVGSESKPTRHLSSGKGSPLLSSLADMPRSHLQYRCSYRASHLSAKTSPLGGNLASRLDSTLGAQTSPATISLLTGGLVRINHEL